LRFICALGVGAFVGFYKFGEHALAFADRVYTATLPYSELITFGGLLNPLAGRSFRLFGLGFEPGTLMIGAGAFM
jgi:hypothetical protein